MYVFNNVGIVCCKLMIVGVAFENFHLSRVPCQMNVNERNNREKFIIIFFKSPATICGDSY